MRAAGPCRGPRHICPDTGLPAPVSDPFQSHHKGGTMPKAKGREQMHLPQEPRTESVHTHKDGVLCPGEPVGKARG